MNDIKIVGIGDIHLGSLDSEYQFNNLEDYFFKYCEENVPDIIIVNGDIMDEGVSLNSKASIAFQKFIDKLQELDSIICIIEGTNTHDNKQIKVFNHRVNEKFRIYNTVQKDYIKGLKFLFIPEEYMVNPEEYYKEYLNENYDFIFGHGTLNHVGFAKYMKKSRFKKLTSPMWDYEEQFKPITNQMVIFSHYHTYSKKDKFRYIGSYGRYNHNEEETKGFIELTYNRKTNKTTEKFIENEGAKLFISLNESELPEDNNKMIKYLNDSLDKIYKLRIVLDRECDKIRHSEILRFAKSNLSTSVHNKYSKKLKKNQIDTKLISSEVVENKYYGMNHIQAISEWLLDNKKIAFDEERILKIVNNL